MGMLITMLYNALAGIMRAVGDTVAPLLFLVCAALLNVGLDLLFILQFADKGVRGAALATVLAQSVSVILSFVYMWKRYPLFLLKACGLQAEQDHDKGPLLLRAVHGSDDVPGIFRYPGSSVRYQYLRHGNHCGTYSRQKNL